MGGAHEPSGRRVSGRGQKGAGARRVVYHLFDDFFLLAMGLRLTVNFGALRLVGVGWG